jgi:hypothetical protein
MVKVKVKVIWHHRWEKVDNFLLHLNSIHTNIQFAMEAEGLQQMATFPSWKNKYNISLGQEVYLHQPLIASTLVPRAKAICDSDSLSQNKL